MNRRTVLAGTSIALSACVSGCASELDPADDERGDETDDEANANGTDDQDAGDDQENANETDGSETGPDRVEAIRIVLRNVTSAAKTVAVSISGDDETYADEERRVEPDDQIAVDTGLADPGGYELTVTVENGPTTTRPVAIDDYDLREGSNIIVEIGGDDVSVVIQE